MIFTTDPAFAKQLDQQDELKEFRKQFMIPKREGKEQIYFLGNSLGLQPITTKFAIQEILDQWSYYGVEGFFESEPTWMHLHDQLTAPLSEIVGAKKEEIVVMNHLTVNLHLLMASFYRPEGKRTKIICEAKAFPSDQYMLESHVKHHGLEPGTTIIEIHQRVGEHAIRDEDIIAQIEKHKDELALVLWGGVNYYTGQVFDIKNITVAAHAAGAKAGFDLAHAAGNIELKLHEWNVDFACWCSYKYLNSGPGAVAGTFIHERYATDRNMPRLAGWWGYEKTTRFKMEKGFRPDAGASGWQLSTPPVILLAAHNSSLEIFRKAGMERLVRKGRQLSDYLVYLLTNINSPDIEILTPESRGCQVSILIKKGGRQVFDKLREEGIFADWREPDVIRVAPVPLYNTFEEVHRFSEVIKKLTA